MNISILLPSRGRPTSCLLSIRSLMERASIPSECEVLVRADADDPETTTAIGTESRWNVHVTTGERYGYFRLNEYYNELATVACGDWVMLWNDDAMMQTDGWDLQIAKFTGTLCMIGCEGQQLWPNEHLELGGSECTWFPVIPRRLVQIMGEFSRHPANDTYLLDVMRLANIPIVAGGYKVLHTVTFDSTRTIHHGLPYTEAINGGSAAHRIRSYLALYPW